MSFYNRWEIGGLVVILQSDRTPTVLQCDLIARYSEVLADAIRLDLDESGPGDDAVENSTESGTERDD